MIKITCGHDDIGVFVMLRAWVGDDPEPKKDFIIRNFVNVNFRILEHKFSAEMQQMVIPEPLSRMRNRNKYRVALLCGCSLKTFLRLWQAAMYRTFVLPVLPYANRFAKRKEGRWSAHCIDSIWRHLNVLEKVSEDGQTNLLPFALYGISPQRGREMFGQGAWRAICKNAYSRNLKIARCLPDIQGSVPSVISVVVRLPSSLLDFLSRPVSGGGGRYEVIEVFSLRYVAKYLKGKWNNTGDVVGMRRLYRDCLRMGATPAQLDILPPQRVFQLHDRLVEDTNARKVNGILMQTYLQAELVQKAEELKCGAFSCRVIRDSLGLKEEGAKMHHCVFSYNRECILGAYLVFSILKNGERYSTLGLRVSVQGVYRNWQETLSAEKKITGVNVSIDQHYMHCNKGVDEAEAEQLAARIEETAQRLLEVALLPEITASENASPDPVAALQRVEAIQAEEAEAIRTVLANPHWQQLCSQAVMHPFAVGGMTV
jgi:hypothetical protein